MTNDPQTIQPEGRQSEIGSQGDGSKSELAKSHRQRQVREAKKRYYQKHKARLVAKAAEWRKNNPEKAAKTMAASTNKHRERINQRARERHRMNPEYRREWRRKNKDKEAGYRRNRREKHFEYAKSWNERNPAKKKLYQSNYSKRNPEKMRMKAAIRRARKANADVMESSEIKFWESRWKQLRRVICYWCQSGFSPKKCHMDHIVPISKGGPHSLSNVCISCSKCNYKKSWLSVNDWNAKITQPVLSL